MVIWRRDERSGAFDTQCPCFFEVTKAEDGWHISAITEAGQLQAAARLPVDRVGDGG